MVKKMWSIKFSLILLLSSIARIEGYTQKTFEFNSTCQQAYKELSVLKINAAKVLIEKAKLQNPNNVIPVYLENYLDIIEVLFNEDASRIKTLKQNISHRIDVIEEATTQSPFYNFCLSNSYLHLAIIEIKNGETTNAALDTRKAYQLIKENKKQFSSFAPNDMIFASIQAVNGTIPNGYKWLAGILGMKGNVVDGIKTLQNFTNSNDAWAKFFNVESQMIYCYLNFYIANNRDETIQYLQSGKLDIVNNHLYAYMAAHLGSNNKQTQFALQTINNRNKSDAYLQTHVWDMLLGYIYLNKLELPQATQYFEKYLQQFKGNFYVKNIYQKLSWAYFLEGNMDAAKKARANVLQKGSANSEGDKQALKEAKTGNWYNATLLKARLQNDGGYNSEALKILQGKTIESFTTIDDKLEFVYRVGRINDDLKNYKEAVNYYTKAIDLGQDRTEYYAARAALQIALIFEKQGNCKEAIVYYNKCLAMDDHDYKNSIDQKAKSGLARCGKE